MQPSVRALLFLLEKQKMHATNPHDAAVAGEIARDLLLEQMPIKARSVTLQDGVVVGVEESVEPGKPE